MLYTYKSLDRLYLNSRTEQVAKGFTLRMKRLNIPENLQEDVDVTELN